MKTKTDLERVRAYREDIEFYTQVIDTLKRLVGKIEKQCQHEFMWAGRTHGGEYQKCVKCDEIREL